MSEDKTLRRFNGDDEDPGKALKRWKLWAQAKLLTFKDFKKEQRGPWLFTLLEGKAWDACEHMSLDELAKPEGEDQLWKILESRFPEKEPFDQMGEALGAVFALSAKENEDLKAWTGRVRDTFDQCKRKGQVAFPGQAKGWILLHCAGMTEEQRAIVKAKTQGELEFEVVAQALRSCFPDYKAPAGKKRTIGVFQVDDVTETQQSSYVDDEELKFEDVEAFLSEHQQATTVDEPPFSESEAAEALAVSWGEGRKEIARLRQTRQFGVVNKEKRSFRVEVEELKKRTRCRRCGRVGHWQRECKFPPADKQQSSSASASATGAGYVQHEESSPVPSFVGAAEIVMLEAEHSVYASGLISSPGFGVVDSGCGKTLIGQETLNRLQDLIDAKGFGPVKYRSEYNVFRFGNGMVEKSSQVATLPVGVAQTFGTIDAAIIEGQAPLLLGRPTLVKMGVHLDFKHNKMAFMDKSATMQVNSAGQLLVDILDYPLMPKISTSTAEASRSCSEAVSGDKHGDNYGDSDKKGITNKGKTKITLKKRECRCLLAQMSTADQKMLTPESCVVAELFSPPRFTTEAQKRGYHGVAYDIKTGYNLNDPKVQEHVDKELDRLKPDLLIACPPCTHRGGWERLNRCFRSPLETARLLRQSRAQVRFCVKQIRKQEARGGQFMFEHPWGADTWDDSDMTPLKRKYGVRRVDMCAYGLACPDSQLPIRKATGLMLSRRPEDRGMILHTCPGCTKHHMVEGKLTDGRNVSDFVAQYTEKFVQAIMDLCLGDRSSHDEHWVHLTECEDLECLASSTVNTADQGDVPSVGANASPAGEIEVSTSDPTAVHAAIKKLHANLGHPNNKDLVRILQHSKASSQAIKVARDFQCSICANHQLPSSSLPAKTSRVWEFNDRIGMDVKYLPGWKMNQQVPCVNIVDYASSLQVMTPIFRKEDAELLKGVLRDSWISWAGPPKVLELDPSKPNLSEALGDFCQSLGIDVVYTAAESHWQLGKVERHGQWFERILSRVQDEHHPDCAEHFVDNVIQTQVAKNSLISEGGASPFQIVFGRNPRVPQDLLQDDVHVPSVDASQFEPAFQRAHVVRHTARLAVLQCQDDRALKAALRSRPRPRKEFASGDWVYYWRCQKWVQGQLQKGGRWHGAGILLGRIGVNWIVAHRKSIFRCSPEQLRMATSDEASVATFDANELLGIRMLLEKGQFPKGQFLDLVNQEQPPNPERVVEQIQSQPGAQTAAELFQNQLTEASTEMPEVPAADGDRSKSNHPMQPSSIIHTEDYGPIRRTRHSHKSPPVFLQRPEGMADEDLVEILQETLPEMIDAQVLAQPNSPRQPSTKREASTEPDDREHARVRTEEPSHKSLSCETALATNVMSIEVLTAAFLQKKMQKEIQPSNNSPEVQTKVDASKSLEWETLLGKNAIRIWTGERAKAIKKNHSDRFIGSRFVITNKTDEEGERIKSRWCLQGHLDPDFHEKIMSGACHSPTLHSMSRSLILQILASKGWTLQLGDIKGAFLEAGPLSKKFTPLYAHQPRGGVPGLDPEDVIEVTGNVYGANDAPMNWFSTFDSTTKQIGWQQSQFDSCLYFLRDPTGQLVGVLGAHVDDTITGGQESYYEAAIAALRSEFPYRKWRVGNGEFCGVQYRQDPQTFSITFGQKEYAEHLRPINLSKERLRNKEAHATDREVAALRAINGACNWLSSQSRPDLATQTSFSQQRFPTPKVRDLVFANQLVHRAKQHSGTEITVKSIPWDQLGICYHSDASFGNAKALRTQAGYVAAFVDDNLPRNQPSQWSPFAWKSFKLPRVVASTLAGEAQCFSLASAAAEWMSLLLSEAKHGRFDLRTREQVKSLGLPPPAWPCRDELQIGKITGVTDCKSLYDHLTSPSSVSKCDDKRVSIDLAILRQCMASCHLEVRWCPSQLMLADGLTKDQADPSELLRAALQLGEYQLNREASVLEKKKAQRLRKPSKPE